MAVKLIMLLLFCAMTIFVGFYFRKRAQSVNDFVLGGRKVGPWLTAFAFGTTYSSAVSFVGYAGQFGWRFGTAAIWVGALNSIFGVLLPWVILGRRTRIMTHHLNSTTMPEFFGIRYISTSLKIAASFIIFIFMVPYTASIYNGLSRLFAMAFHIDFVYCIIAMAVITAIYVVLGGYIATAANDFIQGIIMLAGIVAIIAMTLNHNGGFTEAIRSLARINVDEGAIQPGVFTSFYGPDPISLLGVIILTSLGTWGLPQMVSKFYSIKNEKVITTGTVVSTFFSLIVAGGFYFNGSFGRLYADIVERGPNGAVIYDSIVPTMLAQFPDFMIGVVILLIFAASISTLSGLVLASASTITLDFLKGNVIKKMDDKKQLLIIRLLIVTFIIVSSWIAIVQYRGGFSYIAQLMGISWGALAGSFLAPFLYGLYWKRVTKASVWCNFIFASGIMTLNVFFRSSFPAILQSPINAGAFTMIAGLLIVPAVSMLSKEPDRISVDKFFSCYDIPVTVKLRDDLGNNA